MTNFPETNERNYKRVNAPWVLEKARGGSAFLHEVFTSIQGEGLFAGEPTTFIRFQYCPYDCNWCDSKRTWAEPTDENSNRSLFDGLEEIKTRHICITGGEPLSQPKALKEYVMGLKRAKSNNSIRIGRTTYRDVHIISVETSGFLPLPNERWTWKVDSWVFDIKPPGATSFIVNTKTTPRYDQLARLRLQDQVKFVVVDRRDLDFVVETIRLFPTKAQVLISPMNPTKEKGGIETAEMNVEWHQEVIEFCIKEGYRYSPQLHKFVSVH